MYRMCCLAVALAITLPHEAGAVSEKVRKACRDDYFNHCNSFEVGSAELRQCMRKVGRKLTKPCVDALVDAGEISRKEVEERRASGH